jgi:SAM-dependent methyltransferase
MTVTDDGWSRYSIWDHSATVRDLYRARARDEAEEMTCAAQAVELLAPCLRPGDSVLDVGCGSGYLFHSLRRRGIEVDYHGIDASPTLVAIGREELPAFGFDPERLRVLRVEDMTGAADHVVCMNVLSNIDNFHLPLERLLRVAGRTVILRESLGAGSSYRYVRDEFLDPEVDLRVHVNRYDLDEVRRFMEDLGFDTEPVVDRRTGGEPELVIGHPHHWTFLVGRRRD